ncbi:MAG: D-alanine--D-alanine ligase [Candidatus Omnitrophica bacterium]|nr:D-alanine--D-alanine ligase [Candidatus Omnitrophota bacterium]
MDLQKIKIGVLMGGTSAEREVSLVSGRAVYTALEQTGYNPVSVDINTSEPDKIKEIINQAGIDAVFIALHGGQGEDGTIQSILEEMDIPYTGSGPRACARAMDKIKSHRILEEHNITVPGWQVYSSELVENNGLVFPLVIKPSNQGSSIGLSIVNVKKDLNQALKDAQAWSKDIIIEKYLRGPEITVGILGDQILPVIQIKPTNKFYDYQAKYESGKTTYQVPAPLPEDIYAQVQDLGLAAFKALGCRVFSRVDMIYTDDNQIAVLEVNTVPGLTATSLVPKAARAAGISFEELCSKIIEYSLKK